MSLISALELQAMPRASTRILDASWYLPAQQRDAEREFADGHIPGAQRFDFDQKIAAPDTDLPHMLPSSAVLQHEFRALGIDQDTSVVVYDGLGLFAAPRAWWMLRVAGVNNVQVLDGGLPAWRAADLPMATGTSPSTDEGNVVVNMAPRWLATCADVQRALRDGSATVLDARPANRFAGEAAEPRAGLRSGHMPGAVNVPADRLLVDGHMRPRAHLQQRFDAIAPRDMPLICSCGSGVTAAIVALAATLAGRQNVAVYDGSWAEWGQPGSLTVVTN